MRVCMGLAAAMVVSGLAGGLLWGGRVSAGMVIACVLLAVAVGAAAEGEGEAVREAQEWAARAFAKPRTITKSINTTARRSRTGKPKCRGKYNHTTMPD